MTILYNTQTKELGTQHNPYYKVDGKPGDLPNHIVELTKVESDRPPTTETQTASFEWIIDTEQREYRQEWTIRELTKEKLAPSVITKAQGLLMLKQIGLYDQFKLGMGSATEEEQIVFDATKEWNINNDLITKMQANFGMSDEEKYDFFINASKIVI